MEAILDEGYADEPRTGAGGLSTTLHARPDVTSSDQHDSANHTSNDTGTSTSSSSSSNSNSNNSSQDVERILGELRHWTLEQQMELTTRLLGILPSAAVARIAADIQPWLYRDFIGELPVELSLHILSFLDVQTLGRASQVSQHWQRMACSNALWRPQYESTGWSANRQLINWYDEYGEQLQRDELERKQPKVLLQSMGGMFDTVHANTPTTGPGNDLPRATNPQLSPPAPASSVLTVALNNILNITPFAEAPNLSDNSDDPSGHPTDDHSDTRTHITSPIFSSLREQLRLRAPNGVCAVMSQDAYQTLCQLLLHFKKLDDDAVEEVLGLRVSVAGRLLHVDTESAVVHNSMIDWCFDWTIKSDDPSQQQRLMTALLACQQLSAGTSRRGSLEKNADDSEATIAPAQDGASEQKLTSAASSTLSFKDLLSAVPLRLRCKLPGAIRLVPGHFTSDHRPKVNWRTLYRTRCGIERRWRTSIYLTRHLNGHEDGIYCMQFDEQKIVSGSRDRSVRVWDMATRACVRTLVGHSASVLCLQYDDKILVSGSSDSLAIVWDMETGEQLARLIGHTDSVLNLCFDDRFIVTCSKDQLIMVWSRNGPYARLRTLHGHRVAVNGIAMHGDRLVSVSGDRTFRIWNLLTGECLRCVLAHTRGIACVQFDGRRIFTGSSDRTIRVWDAEKGEALGYLCGHTELVRSLHYNGRWLVSGSYDQTIRIWDPETMRVVAILSNGHTGRIIKVLFNATKIVSCSQDRKIIIWDYAHMVDTTFIV